MVRSTLHEFTRTTALVLCAVLAVALIAPAAVAAPGPCKGKNRNDPGCGDGGSGSPPSAGTAAAWLEDTTASPSGYFDLGGAGGNTWTARSENCQTPTDNSLNTASSGTYTCTEVGDLVFSTGEMSHWFFTKKYGAICNAFSNSTVQAHLRITLLRFGWNDNCTDDDSCAVEAIVNPHTEEVSYWTNGKADQVDLIFGGNVTGYVGDETNPFEGGVAGFAVDSIDMVFMNSTRGRIVGVCTAYPYEGLWFFVNRD